MFEQIPIDGQIIDFESPKGDPCKRVQGLVETENKNFATPQRLPCARKKLVFGENLTPELANQRATPQASSSKRSLEEEAVHSCSPSTRFKLDVKDDNNLLLGGSRMKEQLPGVTPISKKSVVEHLMGSVGRKSSSKLKIRRQRIKSLSSPSIDNKQPKINDVLRPRSASVALGSDVKTYITPANAESEKDKGI